MAQRAHPLQKGLRVEWGHEGVKQLELTSEKNLPKAKETLFSQAIIELHTGEYKKESFMRTDNDEISIPFVVILLTFT